MVIHYRVDFEGRAITTGDKEATADGGSGGLWEECVVLILHMISQKDSQLLYCLFLWIALQFDTFISSIIKFLLCHLSMYTIMQL